MAAQRAVRSQLHVKVVDGIRDARELGECYTYVTLPVFAEGKYEVDNLNPVPAGEHFSVTGHILHEIAELPDEAKVKLHTVQ